MRKIKEPLYSVVIFFNAHDAALCSELKRKLLQVSGIRPEQLRKMMARGSLVLKRHADFSTARRIVKAFQMPGVICRLSEQLEAADPYATTLGLRLTPEDPCEKNDTSVTSLICPKCGKSQPETDVCLFCGVVIAKVRQKESVPQADAPVTEPAARQEAEEPEEKNHGNGAREKSGQPGRSAFFTGWQKQMQRLQVWSRRPVNASMRCGIAFFIGILLQTGVLFLGRMLWFVYLATPVGQHYTEGDRQTATAIEQLMNADFFALSWSVSLIVLGLLLAVGAALQFLHLVRYFYDSQEFVGKIVLWFLPMTALAGWVLTRSAVTELFALACFLALIPVALQLDGCLQMVKVILPEIGDTLRQLFSAARGLIGFRPLIKDRFFPGGPRAQEGQTIKRRNE